MWACGALFKQHSCPRNIVVSFYQTQGLSQALLIDLFQNIQADEGLTLAEKVE
jgi:hypothetical protein